MQKAIAVLESKSTWAKSIPAVSGARRKGGTLLVGIGLPIPAGDTQWKEWWSEAICKAPEFRAILLLNGGIWAYAGAEPISGQGIFFSRNDCSRRLESWNTKEFSERNASWTSDSNSSSYQAKSILLMPPVVTAAWNRSAPRPASMQARLSSCDARVVHAAADETLRDPKSLEDPMRMEIFYAAFGEHAAGNKEEAAFLYLAAHLRISRQMLFQKSGRSNPLATMTATGWPLILPLLDADPALTDRVVKRVIEWDRSTPDRFRDREDAQGGDIASQLANIDAALARLPEQIKNDPDKLAIIRTGNEQAELYKKVRDSTCVPGALDAYDIEIATNQIEFEAENLVKTHPFVLARAGGAIKSVSAESSRGKNSRLPYRATVSVTPNSGTYFFAVVDLEATMTPEKKIGSLKTSLVCLTNLSRGQQDASWTDICQDDPNAIKPPQR